METSSADHKIIWHQKPMAKVLVMPRRLLICLRRKKNKSFGWILQLKAGDEFGVVQHRRKLNFNGYN